MYVHHTTRQLFTLDLKTRKICGLSRCDFSRKRAVGDTSQTLTFLHHFSLCRVQWSSHWEDVRGEQNHTREVWVTSFRLAKRGHYIITVVPRKCPQSHREFVIKTCPSMCVTLNHTLTQTSHGVSPTKASWGLETETSLSQAEWQLLVHQLQHRDKLLQRTWEQTTLLMCLLFRDFSTSAFASQIEKLASW